MDNKTTRKALRTEAIRLKAVKLAYNIYAYENELSSELDKFYNKKDCFVRHRMICYSVGIYGNNGRLDEVEVIDFSTKTVKYNYYYY